MIKSLKKPLLIASFHHRSLGQAPPAPSASINLGI